MARILTLTLNPALDVYTHAQQVLPTHKIRCAAHHTHPGGGGINVARVLHRLGADVLALYPAGGITGQQLQALVAAEQVPQRVLPIDQPTRESFSVRDLSTGQEYRFVLPGACLSSAEWQLCLDELSQAMQGPDRPHWLVASGSLPPGVPEDAYAQVARLARRHAVRMVLDTSGAALAAALAAGVDLVKPSLRELRDLRATHARPAAADASLGDVMSQLQAARELITSAQAGLVALSLGADGAMLVGPHDAWRAPALQVPVASTIGAGDSFLAGLVWALDQPQLAGPEALRVAMAAGAAALMGAGTALSDRADVQRLLDEVRCEPVALSQGLQAP